MKRAWVWAAVVAAAQVAVLVWMAGQREWIARYGQPILLRTAPVDPRDPMRGDYVRLDYEISHVPRERCRGDVASWFDSAGDRSKRDRVVYAALNQVEEGLFELESLSSEPPTEGSFLRGRVESLMPHAIQVRYGVEAFFMEQGRARAFEDEVRQSKAGVPVNVRVRVGPSGTAVLTGYEWEPLGLTIELHQTPASEAPERRTGLRRLTGLTVSLKNHGETPLAIVPGRDGRLLRLVPDHRRPPHSHDWVGSARPAPTPVEGDVVLLAPGETHELKVDLESPQWFVHERDSAKAPHPLGELENAWSTWFRIEYRPPTQEIIPELPHAPLIRRLPVRSRAFSPGGAVD